MKENVKTFAWALVTAMLFWYCWRIAAEMWGYYSMNGQMRAVENKAWLPEEKVSSE